MNVLLWVLQALLAVAFLAHGWLFLFPPADMVDLMNADPSIPHSHRCGRGVGRGRPYLAGHYARYALAYSLGSRWAHDRDARCNHSSRNARRSRFCDYNGHSVIVATFVAYMRWKVNPILPRLRA